MEKMPHNPSSQSDQASSAPGTKPPAANPRKRFIPRAPQDNGVPLEEWMVSYSDMVTLLLTMFVALLLTAQSGQSDAGANKDKRGIRGVIENLLQIHINYPYGDESGYGANVLNLPNSPPAGQQVALIRDADLVRIQQRQETLASIRAKLTNQQLDTFITADVEGDGIRLNIPNSILFDSGAAELKDLGPGVLRALKPILESGTFAISVEGHTDNAAIHTDRYPSNWELSAQRAATVVRALTEAGLAPQRLEAVAYADTRPLADNGTDDGRKENRRVSLFLRM